MSASRKTLAFVCGVILLAFGVPTAEGDTILVGAPTPTFAFTTGCAVTPTIQWSRPNSYFQAVHTSPQSMSSWWAAALVTDAGNANSLTIVVVVPRFGDFGGCFQSPIEITLRFLDGLKVRRTD
jgi:hypothetical protein